MKMNATQLRAGNSNPAGAGLNSKLEKNEIYIILDNVLDTYNIGSMFRLADAVGSKKVFLCGKTETPPNPRIKKASINTTEIVEWEYKETALEALSAIRRQSSDTQIVAVEQSAQSVPYDKFDYKLPIALIVGNETYGVSKEVLELCDGVVEIPMFGVNISLNVMVSLAIILYKALEIQVKIDKD
ncbi:MAG: TrmH family RNA methyltransferase [Candidatus Daviesbacteria bacterium]|nr:TrmH family RNA methyltransferase [Candidatus Daviesbacteria bacterium]